MEGIFEPKEEPNMRHIEKSYPVKMDIPLISLMNKYFCFIRYLNVSPCLFFLSRSYTGLWGQAACIQPTRRWQFYPALCFASRGGGEIWWLSDITKHSHTYCSYILSDITSVHPRLIVCHLLMTTVMLSVDFSWLNFGAAVTVSCAVSPQCWTPRATVWKMSRAKRPLQAS